MGVKLSPKLPSPKFPWVYHVPLSPIKAVPAGFEIAQADAPVIIKGQAYTGNRVRSGQLHSPCKLHLTVEEDLGIPQSHKIPPLARKDPRKGRREFVLLVASSPVLARAAEYCASHGPLCLSRTGYPNQSDLALAF
jgi:hypothetical protein